MPKTMYPAARHEAAFSLAVTLTDTTYDPDIRVAVATAFRRATPLLHTAAGRLERSCEMSGHEYGSPHNVLMEQTLYPLYLSCMSPTMGQRLESQVCFSSQHRLCCPSLPLPTQGANRFGLECKEDVATRNGPTLLSHFPLRSPADQVSDTRLPFQPGGRVQFARNDYANLVTDGLRSSGDTRLRARRQWRYRARIDCGLPEQAFDRLVMHRP